MIGCCNRDLFEAWLSQSLIPQLEPGDIIIVDNATFHKGGGIILLTKGFIDILDSFSDDEIAGVLAHEIGHIELGHTKSRIEDNFRLNIIEYVGSVIFRNPLINMTISGMSFVSEQMFSRDQEYEADNYAIALLNNSEYSPVGLIQALQKLSKGKTMPQSLEILSTHPHLDERVSNLMKQV